MRNPSVQINLVFGVLLAEMLLPGSAPSYARIGRPSPDSDRLALERAVRRWDERFREGDVQGLARLYAPDAVSMPFNAPAVRGRAAIAAEFQKFFAQNTGQRHSTRIEKLDVDGGLAVERSRYEMRFRPKSDKGEVIERGKHVEVRRRINGEWLILSEIWNTDK